MTDKPPALATCSCGTIPQMLCTQRPGAVYKWAVECPICGKCTTWRKTQESAAQTWNQHPWGFGRPMKA